MARPLGLLTAALAVAAHAAGSGAPPDWCGRRSAGGAGGDGRCARRDHRSRRRRQDPARPARGRAGVRSPSSQRRRAQPPGGRSAACLGDAGRACGGGRCRRASDRRERSALPSHIPCGVAPQSDRRHAVSPSHRCTGRRGRSAAAVGTSARRVGVAPGSAGQPAPLTDIPTTPESHNRMRFNTRARSRALITAAATGAAMSIGLLAGSRACVGSCPRRRGQPHPRLLLGSSPSECPTSLEKGALTTQLSVAPAQRGVREHGGDAGAGPPSWIEMPPRARSVLSRGQLHPEPASRRTSSHCSVSRCSCPTLRRSACPATQTYSDGTIVKWDQPTPPGGAEPEHPAPEIALTGAKADAGDDHPMPVAQTAVAQAAAQPAADNTRAGSRAALWRSPPLRW